MKTTGYKLYQDLECQIQSDFVHEVIPDTRVLRLLPLVTSMRKLVENFAD